METTPHTIRLDRRELFPVFFAAFVYSVIVYLVGIYVLQQFPNSADEFAYLYQAHTFSLGNTWNVSHPLQEALSPFFIQTHEHKVFSIFPPGWAFILGLGVFINVPGLINPIISGLSIIVLYYLSRYFLSPNRSWVVILLWIASPMVLLNSTSFFSHPLCTSLILLSILFLVRFSMFQNNVDGLLIGLFSSAAFCTRELTSIALILLPYLFVLYQTKKRIHFLICTIIGALPTLLLYGWYCNQITGYWFYPPRYLLEDEYLGFGWRTIRVFDYVEQQYHGPIEALSILNQNISLLLGWTTLFFPAASLILLHRYKNKGWMMVFVVSSILLILVYMLYPSDGGNQYGARFYYESLPFLAITAVYGLPGKDWWFTRIKSKTAIGSIICMAILVYGMMGFSKLYQTYQTIYIRKDLFRQIEHKGLSNALVFIASPSGDMTQGDLIRNFPDMNNAGVIYAWDLGSQRNQELIDHFPDREYYRYQETEVSGFRVITPYQP